MIQPTAWMPIFRQMAAQADRHAGIVVELNLEVFVLRDVCFGTPGFRMRKASEYSKHAEECRQLAKTAITPEHAAMLENMAQTWESLAQEREQRLARMDRIAALEYLTERP